MGRRIGLPITVELDAAGLPVAFTWRDHTYHVQVIAQWHLQDRWWMTPAEADMTGKGASDRAYYRVQAPDLQAFELYHDTTSAGLWVLDKVLD
jgi:hypothetical protein